MQGGHGVSAPELKVVQLHESNFRDPVAALRTLADEIERGDFGAVAHVGVVVLGDTLEVFSMGIDSDVPSTGMLLHAGFMRLSSMIANHGRE